MIRTALLSTLLAAGIGAQTFATVPNVTSFQNVDRPFAGGIGRYQQWFSAASLAAWLPEPMRSAYFGMKRAEMGMVAGLDAAAMCTRYAEIY